MVFITMVLRGQSTPFFYVVSIPPNPPFCLPTNIDTAPPSHYTMFIFYISYLEKYFYGFLLVEWSVCMCMIIKKIGERNIITIKGRFCGGFGIMKYLFFEGLIKGGLVVWCGLKEGFSVAQLLDGVSLSVRHSIIAYF